MFPREHMKTSRAGDVNPEPIPSRRGLLEYSQYREIWTTLSALRLGLGCTPRAWGPRNFLCPPSTRSEYVLVTYATLSVQH
jgi:hypothetical protein